MEQERWPTSILKGHLGVIGSAISLTCKDRCTANTCSTVPPLNARWYPTSRCTAGQHLDLCRPERLKPIAERLQMDADSICENVLCARAATFDAQEGLTAHHSWHAHHLVYALHLLHSKVLQVCWMTSVPSWCKNHSSFLSLILSWPT